MNDTIDGARVDGDITIDGKNIYDADLDVVTLRARVGMVFQKPNPFPKSISENVAYGPRIHGLAKSKAEHAVISRRLSRNWPAVEGGEGNLVFVETRHGSLSGGQQSALWIARAHRGSRPR